MVELGCNREFFDRLKKEYAKAKDKKDDKVPFRLKNVKEVIDWQEIRPHLTQDFVPNHDIALRTAENVPVGNQEHQLITDLLVCFLGGNAYYIQAEPLTKKNATRTFKVHQQLDVKLKDLAIKCLEMAAYYSQLCRFTQENRILSAGRVNQALVHAMDNSLIQYKTFINELEKLHLRHPLNLQELWFQIQDVMQIMETLCGIALDISHKEMRGGATLTYLHEKNSHHITATYCDLLKYLLKTAAAPYMKSVQEWIFNGIIFDPFDEFMIVEKPKSSFKDCQTLEYWEKRYQLRKDCVPIFLESVTNEIWKSGVYLNVIKEYVLSSDRKLNLAPIEELKYSCKTSKFLEVIRRAYIHSSSYLLQHMMDKYNLLNRLFFMKKFFLVQQGDFVAQLIDTCYEELSKPILEIMTSRLETLVDMAIKGVENPIRDDFTVVLQPQDLLYQVSRIFSASSDQDQKSLGLNTKLSGFESFALGMKCRWPISLVFNARIISCYQMLFRLFFYCKHVEQRLFRVWIINQRLRDISLLRMKPYSIIFSLRHKMIYFIQNMLYYMMEEVIEPNWINFLQQVEIITSISHNKTEKFDFQRSKVYSIDDLMEAHKKFLDNSMCACLLSNTTLFPIFMKLLNTCLKFASFIIQYESEICCRSLSEEGEFSKTIIQTDKQYQEDYLHFLTSISKFGPTGFGAITTLEIFHRVNFNSFF